MGALALKILVADDIAANQMVVKAVATRLGHAVVTAGDGREAVRIYQAEQPDLVFMDVMMPEMDGLEAVRAIRALPSDRWVPVVFYSALDEMDDVIKGLESGGDDYLAKPADLRLLRAKINSYAHAIALQRKVLDYAEELAAWRAQSEEEMRIGGHVMARLTDTEGLRDPMLRHFNRPTSDFSGDLLCATRGPGEVLYLMLADATGHGLPAALSAMPLTQIFYGMAAKGFSLTSIAEELNRRIKRLMPVDRFVAATLAAIDVRNQTVEVWNGSSWVTLWTSGGGPVVGWLNSKMFLETGDAGRSQGWTALVLDTNGNGKRDEYVEPDQPVDPTKDKRVNSGFYAVMPNPRDGSIWGSSMPRLW